MNRGLKYRPYVAGPAVNNNIMNRGEVEVSPELLTVSLRYKKPDGIEATEISRGVTDEGRDFGRASADFKFASAVAGFGMLLRESPYKGASRSRPSSRSPRARSATTARATARASSSWRGGPGRYRPPPRRLPVEARGARRATPFPRPVKPSTIRGTPRPRPTETGRCPAPHRCCS